MPFLTGSLRVLFFLFPTLLVACGASYETIEVKEYRMTVIQNDDALKDEFRNLIAEFNFQSDRNILKYVDDASDANSAIIVTKGLEDRDGKVGWGQWFSESKEDNPVFHAPGKQPVREVRYSMRLEFDEDYLRDRMNSTEWDDIVGKQKLFFHEVGHGLQMDHHPSQADVMYEDITGQKNFDVFFNRVRKYMADQ